MKPSCQLRRPRSGHLQVAPLAVVAAAFRGGRLLPVPNGSTGRAPFPRPERFYGAGAFSPSRTVLRGGRLFLSLPLHLYFPISIFHFPFSNFQFPSSPPPRLLNQIHNLPRRMRISKAPRVLGKRFNLPGLVEEGENLARQSFSGQFRFRDQPPRLRIRHRLRVAQLVAVRGTPKRNENRR